MLIVFIIIGWLLPLVAQAGNFGVGAYLSSVPDGERSTVADQMRDLGMAITRQTFVYTATIDFAPYDDAVTKTRDKNIDILGLFEFSGDRPSVSDWTTFVDAVVSRYKGKVAAWEIFNEPDNYLSASDYKTYLEASYTKIKAIDSGAKVLVGGLTARSEAIKFWDGLYDAGGKSFFDVLGLHPYRDDPPELVKFNVGDFTTSIELAANTIRSHGGGKKIWLTEFGLQSGQVGQEKQANYLVRSYLLARTIPEVEKIIMYRLKDTSDETFGLIAKDGTKKIAYTRWQDILPSLDGTAEPERIFPYNKKILDGFDAGVVGWNTKGSSNASLNLSSTSGYVGSGMKYEFNFSASQAYALAEKFISIDGEPTALGIWAKGPVSTNVLKLRVKDAQGETFQFDLGKVTEEFKFYRFGLTTDSAKTSWDGDGKLDYPIKFDSIVYDRQGGGSSGTLTLDELVALYGTSDLYVLKFGSKLAYWRSAGPAAIATACGKSLSFTETPQTVTVSSCTAWDSGTTSASDPAPAPSSSDSASAPAKTTTAPKTTQSSTTSPSSSTPPTTPTPGPIDLAQSNLTVPSPTARAGEPIEISLAAKDAAGNATDPVLWQLAVSPNLGTEITQPSEADKSHAKLTLNQNGRYVLTATISGNPVGRPLVLYVQPTLPEPTKIAPGQQQTIDADTDSPFVLSGVADQVLALTLTNLPVGEAPPDHVGVLIESEPAYFRFERADNAYQGSVRLPTEVGQHQLTVFADQADGSQQILHKGTLTVAEVGTAPYSRPVVQTLLIGLAFLLLVVLGLFLWLRRHHRTLTPRR